MWLRSLEVDFTNMGATKASQETGQVYPTSVQFRRTVFLTKTDADRLTWARYGAYALVGMSLAGAAILVYFEKRTKKEQTGNVIS